MGHEFNLADAHFPYTGSQDANWENTMDNITERRQNEDILDRTPVYLKPNVKIEPLFCGWLVWSHLLSPIQSAMNLTYRYIPLLQSFVANPQVHVAATKDPKLFGGPFVHLPPTEVPKVRDLISKTKQNCGRLLDLANDLKTFDIFLHETSNGFSLNDCYSKIPSSLAGLIELMYDTNNNPRIHLLEELLYAEYGPDLRAGAREISLSAILESDRRFFMSTPRLPSGDNLTIVSDYANPQLDKLFSMRIAPLPLSELETEWGLTRLANSHSHLFTKEPPERAQPDYTNEDVRIRYFGHACVLVQTSRIAILIDPIFAYQESTSNCSRFTICDLPDKIDYVILSHCHQDHCCAEMLLNIRQRVGKVIIPTNNRGGIADPSMKLILAQLGFFDVISVKHFDTISFDEGKIVSIPFPGEHADLDIYSKQSIFIEIKRRRLLFLVDSDGRDMMLYRRIAGQINATTQSQIDALFLGMECYGAPLTWLYGPLLSKSVTRKDDESRRLSGSNYERALGIIKQFRCARVFVYAMGQEPWLKYLMGLEYSADSVQLKESEKLVHYCRSEGIISERLYGSQDISV
jgi:L-ascorbate metabolism protein UlaG (beta-lactamase superfamily)